MTNEAELLNLDGVALGASVGWSGHPDNAVDAEDLFTVADVSLRAAKALGKGVSHSPLNWLTEQRTL